MTNDQWIKWTKKKPTKNRQILICYLNCPTLEVAEFDGKRIFDREGTINEPAYWCYVPEIPNEIKEHIKEAEKKRLVKLKKDKAVKINKLRKEIAKVEKEYQDRYGI